MGRIDETAGHGTEGGCPVHRAEHLLLGKRAARILLGEEVYVLRQTRAGELILRKWDNPDKNACLSRRPGPSSR